jgi:hypothetical protein
MIERHSLVLGKESAEGQNPTKGLLFCQTLNSLNVYRNREAKPFHNDWIGGQIGTSPMPVI